MVKLENGMVSKEDKDGHGDCQELLSPPQPSSPTSSLSSSHVSAAPPLKVANGCNGNNEDEDGEQEPLLQDPKNCCKAVNRSAALTTASTTPKVDKGPRYGGQSEGDHHNGDLTIPIFVNSDRLSSDPAATASLHSSPSHCISNVNRTSPHIINPSLLPMAASTALAASNRDPRHSTQIPQHDEVVSIQMTAANSCRTIEDSGRPLSDREVFECSWQSMCGPKPKKITVIIVVVLSIWASFILGLNVYKQVSGLETNLSFMTEKVHILQKNYVEMHELALKEIDTLKSHIEELKSRQHEPPSNTVERRNTEERMSKSLDLSKESTKARHSTAKPSTQQQQQQQQQQQPQRAPRTTASTPAALTDKEECTTDDGVKCIFPFTLNGEVKTGCVQRWHDIKPWCATKVDENGNFIRFDNSAWGNCNKDCPKS